MPIFKRGLRCSITTPIPPHVPLSAIVELLRDYEKHARMSPLVTDVSSIKADKYLLSMLNGLALKFGEEQRDVTDEPDAKPALRDPSNVKGIRACDLITIFGETRYRVLFNDEIPNGMNVAIITDLFNVQIWSR